MDVCVCERVCVFYSTVLLLHWIFRRHPILGEYYSLPCLLPLSLLLLHFIYKHVQTHATHFVFVYETATTTANLTTFPQFNVELCVSILIQCHSVRNLRTYAHTHTGTRIRTHTYTYRSVSMYAQHRVQLWYPSLYCVCHQKVRICTVDALHLYQ